MPKPKEKILLTFTVSAQDVLTRGIRDVLADLRLEDGGKVIVPVSLGGGYMIGNPGPCGTWAHVDSATPSSATPEGNKQ